MNELSRKSLSCLLMFALTASTTAMGAVDEKRDAEPQTIVAKDLRERYGIEVKGVRHAAGGYMLDFRYKVVDTKKAAGFLGHDLIPQLLDEKRNARLITPTPPKVGPLRQTGAVLKEGRTYFVFFANPGKGVKVGDPVAIVLGDVTLGGLTVQ
jgi:hypothetical protein